MAAAKKDRKTVERVIVSYKTARRYKVGLARRKRSAAGLTKVDWLIKVS